MNFDSLFVDAVDHAVKDLVIDWLECDDVKPSLENDISGRILHNSFEVVLVVQMVLPNVNDVTKFLSTLTDEELVDPK